MRTVTGSADVLCIYKIVRTLDVEATVEDDATDAEIEETLERVALAEAKELTVDCSDGEYSASNTEITSLTVWE